MKFCSISCLRCRSCQGFCGGHALHWTQDSGLQGFVAAMRCVGLTHTWAGSGATHAWDSLTHHRLNLQGEVKYKSGQCACPSNTSLSYIKEPRARGLPPPHGLAGWWGLAHSPARDPAFLHHFPNRAPHPTNGALPWQTHRHRVSAPLVCASRLELLTEK